MIDSILLIDDSKYDLFLAEDLIRDYCQVKEVVCVESAQKGLDYLKSKENSPNELPQIILLDIKMPFMDGFDFLNVYNTLSETIKENCKIYMLSSSLDPTDINKAKRNENVIDFFEKPITEENFNKMVSLFS